MPRVSGAQSTEATAPTMLMPAAAGAVDPRRRHHASEEKHPREGGGAVVAHRPGELGGAKDGRTEGVEGEGRDDGAGPEDGDVEHPPAVAGAQDGLDFDVLAL